MFLTLGMKIVIVIVFFVLNNEDILIPTLAYFLFISTNQHINRFLYEFDSYSLQNQALKIEVFLHFLWIFYRDPRLF